MIITSKTITRTYIIIMNNKHRAESAFKSLALALRSATELNVNEGTPSTKGVI